MEQTSVSTKYQVVIPKAIRRKINLKPGQKMDVDLAGEQIILSRTKQAKKLNWPHDHIKLLKNAWKDVDPKKYIEEERNSWD